jgi:hypothetical protein
MFEIKMNGIKQSLAGTCLFACSALWGQSETFDFTPKWKKGDKFVYQLAETKYKQNPYGQYLFIQYDTSYMIFNITDKNDSNTLINLNYSKGYYNGIPTNDVMKAPDPLQTQTYQLVFDTKGEFIELANWEDFSKILINNLKTEYKNNLIDSITLKYYYIYYHSQENVEKTLLPRVLELTYLLGKSYTTETDYTIAKELVNPFGGRNLMKSGTFRVSKDYRAKNSVFFSGSIKTNYEDNEALQDDYYAFIDADRPENFVEAAPYIYMTENYEYQWGNINKFIIAYGTTHTVYLGNDKQGLDRTYRLISF